MLMTAHDLYCPDETLAVQVLADQLVDIVRIAVRDEKACEHLQCAQNLTLVVQNAEMHAEAMGMLDPVAVARLQVVHRDGRVAADLQRVMAQQGDRRFSIQDKQLVVDVEVSEDVNVIVQTLLAAQFQPLSMTKMWKRASVAPAVDLGAGATCGETVARLRGASASLFVVGISGSVVFSKAIAIHVLLGRIEKPALVQLQFE